MALDPVLRVVACSPKAGNFLKPVAGGCGYPHRQLQGKASHGYAWIVSVSPGPAAANGAHTANLGPRGPSAVSPGGLWIDADAHTSPSFLILARTCETALLLELAITLSANCIVLLPWRALAPALPTSTVFLAAPLIRLCVDDVPGAIAPRMTL